MARKKKKGPTPAKNKKKKKNNPIAELLHAHPELTKEQASEIVHANISFEEWSHTQAQAKEARRLANQERMAKLLCTQHLKLSYEDALQCVQQNLTPEEYFAAQRKKRASQQRTYSHSDTHQRRKGKPRFGKKRPHSGPNPKQAIRQKQIDQLLEQYPDLTRAIAGQVVSGNLTIQQYKQNCEKKKQKAQTHRTPEEIEQAKQVREERKQKLQERVQKEAHLGAQGDAYMSQLIEENTHVEILRFHAPSFDGNIIQVEPFLLFLQTKAQPKLKLIKRYCALLFKKEEQAQVYSQLKIAPQQFSLRQYPHREPSKRYTIPKALLQEGEQLSVLLHNGLLVSGRIVWVDRFQFLLQLPEGAELFIFRHSIHQAAQTEAELDDAALSLAEFFSSKPSLPKMHPETLSPSEIEIPSNFDDFPVKDELYNQYLEAFEQGDMELKPVTVRREGDSYVLIDGYRRLTLAKEKDFPELPIIVM